MKNFLSHSGARLLSLLLVGSLMLTLTFSGTNISRYLQTSILGYPEHAPFDGTVYPVKKVPDWVNLSSEKWNYDYTSLSSSDLVEVPVYNPDNLKISTDNLKWGDANDNKIRNAKITYSVPYMGNYKLDGKEFAGSHPAVDVKIPEGTPIYAIANGTVIKASTQSSGFGHHIVIQHNDFPTLDDANASETIFSSYSHLSDVLVSEGDVISKGDQIATSGSTGTATTPHLHFQIDNNEAPWHPFWPFTWQEVNDAGLDFFSAINEGLNQDSAIATTMNPLKFVQKYLDGQAATNDESAPIADSYVPDVNDGEDVDVLDKDVVEDEPAVADEASEEAVDEVVEVVEVVLADPPALQFEFEVKPKYYVGAVSSATVSLRDQYGNKFEGFSGDLTVGSTSGYFTASPAIIRSLDFDKNGDLELELKKLEEGRDKMKIEYNGDTFYSSWFDIVDTSGSVSFSDLPTNNEYFEAVSYLVDEGIVKGYSDGTFRPNQTVSRVEALKFIYEGIKESIVDGSDLPFPDVSLKEWYSGYLFTAYSNGVVTGYPDGTFKPTNTVNRAEFYKLLFNGMAVDVNPNVEVAPFEDVAPTEWYAPYVALAKELKIIDPTLKTLDPSGGMSRGEVAYAIYRLMIAMK